MGQDEDAAAADIGGMFQDEVARAAEPHAERHRVARKAALVPVIGLIAIGEQMRDAHARLRIDDDEVCPEARLFRRAGLGPRDAADRHLGDGSIRQVQGHRHAGAHLRRSERAYRDSQGAQLAGSGLHGDPFRHVPHREDEARGRHRIDDLQAACRGSGPLFRQLRG